MRPSSERPAATPRASSFRLARLPLFLPIAAALLGGCNRAPASEGEAPEAPVQVETEPVTMVEAPIELRFTGTLKGMRESDLAANASGRVLRTEVERGTRVEAGTVVVQLDTSAAQLSLLEAKVGVATSTTQEEINEAECARYEQLRAADAISPLEYDQVTAKCKTAPLQREAAQARQSIAAKNVGDGTIRAPFSGIVSDRYVEVGEYVQPSSRVITIAEIGQLRLEFTVPEASFAALKGDADVTFRVGAYPDKTFRGSVKFVAGALRSATRDLVVEAVVDNDEMLLRPGMFADVSLNVGEQELPAIPTSALFHSHDKSRTYVVVEGRVEERVLQLGPTVGDRVAVRDGVSEGDLVVTSDRAGLKNGDRTE